MTIRGHRSLNRKLREMQRLGKLMVRAAMEKQADQIVQMMKSVVPVDTGALRDSIGWTWGRAPRGTSVRSNVRSRDGDMVITIYAKSDEAFYAHMIEFGTAAHVAGGKFAGASIPAIPAQPFFYVTFRARRKAVKSAISRAIRKAAKQVAAGGSS